MFFKQKALAFVDTHVAGAAYGKAVPLCRPAVLIAGVTRFMGGGQQSFQELVASEPGGNPLVASVACAERMDADIETAPIEVETEYIHETAAELLLGIDGIVAGKISGSFSLTGYDVFEEDGKLFFQMVKYRCDQFTAVTGAVEIKKCVVGSGQGRLCRMPRLGFFAGEVDDFLKIFKKALPVVVLSLGAPAMLAAGSGK